MKSSGEYEDEMRRIAQVTHQFVPHFKFLLVLHIWICVPNFNVESTKIAVGPAASQNLQSFWFKKVDTGHLKRLA